MVCVERKRLFFFREEVLIGIGFRSKILGVISMEVYNFRVVLVFVGFIFGCSGVLFIIWVGFVFDFFFS